MSQVAHSYDALNRLSRRTLSSTATPYVTTYSYLQGANAKQTTELVSTLTNGSDSYSYTYDSVGNILTVSKNGNVVESYGYDGLNQLTNAAVNGNANVYTYDSGGNLRSVFDSHC